MKFPIYLILFSAIGLHADFVKEPISYELDEAKFSGHLIYTQKTKGKLPGILFVPNWMGPDTEATLEKAMEIADDSFAVFVVDMYGVNVRPKDWKEAGAAAGFVRGDRALMRTRAQKAIDVFKGLAEDHPIDPEKMLAIGFCFGGGTLLEYARVGTEDLDGIVSFHGDLMSPTLEADAGKTEIPLLVLHGADDPYVPQEHVQEFIATMQSGGVDDWQLVQFSGAVHSFTDPTADSDGARYHKRTAERAFEMMDDFAEEVLELDD
ncbi:MAG: dienelactone hydrolase family protein [Verrucomicrobiota bacterium]